MERRLYEQVSQYYPLAKGLFWMRSALLAEGKHAGIQCSGDILLTHFLISAAGFGSVHS